MKKRVISSIIGMAAGFLNGLFGAGGGALVVPASQKFLQAPTHEAHASGVAVMLPLSIVSAVIYSAKIFASPDWPGFVFILVVSAGGMTGGFVGAKLLNKIPPKLLHKVFGVFIAAAGLKMIL